MSERDPIPESADIRAAWLAAQSAARERAPRTSRSWLSGVQLTERAADRDEPTSHAEIVDRE
jgi:hypothetical protein